MMIKPHVNPILLGLCMILLVALLLSCNDDAPSASDVLPAPTQLSATAFSPSQVELTWKDNSDEEAGFRIERRVNIIIDDVHEVGANSIRFRDVFLNPNTNYSYRVAAFDESGASAPTEMVSVTTFANIGPWRERQSETSDDLYGVAQLPESQGIAVGKDGTILRTTDAGETWMERQSGTTNSLLDVFFVNAQIGTAVGEGFPGGTAVIRRTRDGGFTWFEQAAELSQQNLHGVHFVHPDTGAIVGTSATILTTTDGGANWVVHEPPTEHDLTDVHFVDSKTGFATGENGLLIKTEDRGVNWQNIDTGTTVDLHAIHLADRQHGGAAGSSGTILITENGESWRAKDSGVDADLLAIQFISQDTIMVAGGNGTILKSVDGGTSWKPQQSNTQNALFGLHLLDTRSGLVVGEYGTILQTVTGGE